MILLVRHAATICSKGRCIGRTHVPLSDDGVRSAQRFAEELSSTRIARLYSSPSGRALESMAPLAAKCGLSVNVVPVLDEIDMGAWDGRSFDDIRQQNPEAYAERGKRFADFRPPGGESFGDVANRAVDFLQSLASEEHVVVVMTHAGVIRSILCRVTGHPLHDLFYFNPSHLGCTLLRFSDGVYGLVATDMSPATVTSFL